MHNGFLQNLHAYEDRLIAYLSASERDRSAIVEGLQEARDIARDGRKKAGASESCRYVELELCAWGLGPIAESTILPPRVGKKSPRAGYLIDGKADQAQIEVFPYFMYCWAKLRRNQSSDTLKEAFPDAWAIDYGLWCQLAQLRPSPAQLDEIALTWLKSPGRFLVLDYTALRLLSKKTKVSALLSVVGSSLGVGEAGTGGSAQKPVPVELGEARLGMWMMTAPGEQQSKWQPVNADVPLALEMLDDARLMGMRAGALRWLLDRCGEGPIYSLGGTRRDLRADLAERLEAMAAVSAGGRQESALAMLWSDGAVLSELEWVLLKHASQILASANGGLNQHWHVAGWLYRCLSLGPFQGDDPEILAAELRTQLSKEQETTKCSLFGAQNGLDKLEFRDSESLGEWMVLTAVASHYAGPGPHLKPVPPVLVRMLRAVAQGAGKEVESQSLLSVCQKHLQWSLPHVTPSWISRWFLSSQRLTWLADSASQVHDDCRRAFADSPLSYAWMVGIIHAEGSNLLEPEANKWCKFWQKLVEDNQRVVVSSSAESLSAHELCLMAAGLLAVFDSKAQGLAFQLLKQAQPVWQPYLLEAFAIAVSPPERTGLWRRSLMGLWTILDDESYEEQSRLDAALMLLRQASKYREGEGIPFLLRLSGAMHKQPFNRHVGLKREMARLQFSTQLAG